MAGVPEVKAWQIWFWVKLSCQSPDDHFLVPSWSGVDEEHVL